MSDRKDGVEEKLASPTEVAVEMPELVIVTEPAASAHTPAVGAQSTPMPVSSSVNLLLVESKSGGDADEVADVNEREVSMRQLSSVMDVLGGEQQGFSFEDMMNWTDEQRREFVDKFTPEQTTGILNAARDMGWVEEKVNISFRNIYWKKEGVLLVNGVSGYLKPGMLLGVLGEGATHLFEVLSGRARGGVVSGEILVNGTAPDESFKRLVGYVTKDDFHLPTLTVRETVRFSCYLRASPKMSRAVKDIVVEIILKNLGIAHVANSIVGDGNLRGISGGEKRRLSLAVEYAALHSCLIADLPTNGLDAATAWDLVKKTRMAAMSGNAIAHSLVQASPELLREYDSLLMISRGSSIYFGPPNEAMDHFIRLGFEKPVNKSVPDFLIELCKNPVLFYNGRPFAMPNDGVKQITAGLDRNDVSVRKTSLTIPDAGSYDADGAVKHKAVAYIPEASVRQSALRDVWHVLHKGYRSSRYFKDLGEELWTNMEPRFDLKDTTQAVPEFNSRGREQIVDVIVRQFKITIRNPALSIGATIVEMLVAFIIGFLFFNMGSSQGDARGRVGFLYFAMMHMAFSCMQTIPVLIAHRAVFYSQANAGYYRKICYYIAVFLNNFPFAAWEVFVFSIITYGLVGLNDFPLSGRFWFYYLMLLLLTLTTRALALLTTSFSPNAIVAQALTPTVLVLMSTLCGYLIPADSIPIGWKWVHTISLFTYVFKGLVYNEMSGLTFHCSASEKVPPPWDPLLNEPAPDGFGGHQICQFNTGKDVLRFYTMDTDDMDTQKWANLGYLIIFLGIFNILACVAMIFIDWSGTATVEKELEKKALAEEEETTTKRRVGGLKANASYIEFRDLSYDVTVPNPAGKGKVQKRLLSQLNGYCPPGRMVALMGATGAGKSTLLDVLAGKKTEGVIHGKILCNNVPTDEYFSRIAGYVEQFDSHVESMTVREAVTFSAKLRLPSTVSDLELARLVNRTIDQLDMTHVADEIIGSSYRGGLSPELRKKVTIAVELIMDPGVLFLDEPTTGLTSAAAMDVMTAVRNLADEISVVCTIHQPSEEIFKMFDWLYLLERGGKTVYFGPVNEIGEYFEKNGLGKAPADRNIADWILEVVRDRQIAVEKGGVEDAYDIWQKSEQYAKVRAQMEAGIVPANHKSMHFTSLTAAGFLVQFLLLTRRFIMQEWREFTPAMVRCSVAIFNGLLLGSVFYQIGDTATDANSVVSIAFFAILIMFFSAQGAIPRVVDARAVYFRETKSNMYSPFAYYCARTTADFPIVIGATFIFCIISYWLAGLRHDEDGKYFGYYLAVLFVSALTAYAFAELIATIAPNAEVATALSTFILIINMLFTGFLIVRDSMPDFWVFLYYINLFRYAIFFLMVNELDGKPLSCNLSGAPLVRVSDAPACDSAPADDLNCYRPVCFSTSGNDILRFFSANPHSFGLYFGVTIIFLVGIRVLGYIALKKVNHIKR